MKRFILLFCAVCLYTALSAQCDPVADITDTEVVLPSPFTPDNPGSGISDTACINQPFEFVVSLSPPDEFNGTAIASININPEGGVTGLPDGIDYVCNPPNCVFDADTTGCIVLTGTPTNVDQIGANSLTITGLILFSPSGQFPISFPSPLIAPGEYFLFVKEEGAENCFEPVGTNELANFVSMTNRPNPFSAWTTIVVNSDLVGNYQFAVHDVLGRSLEQRVVNITEGENLIEFDGSNLANGIYVYSLSDGKNVISKRMILHK
ncbi:MAG: T9SS type A sorting domain-containing protein [Bacteroidota bacterium]